MDGGKSREAAAALTEDDVCKSASALLSAQEENVAPHQRGSRENNGSVLVRLFGFCSKIVELLGFPPPFFPASPPPRPEICKVFSLNEISDLPLLLELRQRDCERDPGNKTKLTFSSLVPSIFFVYLFIE